jgi:hypothetical protein
MSTITNLKADVHFLCGSTSASYPDADVIRNLNIAYNDTARLIWTSAGGWQFDDSNATTLPIARTTMVHNQQDYSLPSTAQRIEEVVVKDSNADWHKLKPFDIHDSTIAPEEYLETAGLPLYYDMIGRSVMLYPKPSSAYCTMASGLGIYISRDVTEFAVTASTETPGFAAPFHRILSYAAAIDFEQDQSSRQILIAQKDRLEKAMVEFYAKRNVEQTARIKPRQRKMWRQYI